MRRKEVLETLSRVRDASKERKFTQSIELIVNFKGINFKRPENRVDVDVKLPHPTGKQSGGKVLVFIRDKNFAEQIKGKADILPESDIPGIKKKDLDGLLEKYPAFLAEGPVMLTVGKYLGQQLAPKSRMPLPIQANLASFSNAAAKASSVIKLTNKKGKYMPVVQNAIGNEKNNDEELADNALAIYNALIGNIEGREQSIKSVFLKMTMGPAIKIGEEAAPSPKGEKK